MSKRFAIITHTPHKVDKHKIYAYRPYMIEMNLWLSYVDECKVVAPLSKETLSPLDAHYYKEKLNLEVVPRFDITSFLNLIKSIFVIPIIVCKIFKVCFWADHIHLRCPGNIGLLGVLVQVFFPKKIKTVKYAGNWDPNSKQPKTYILQKKILSNTFLTKNCKVLVYGNWKNQTKNIKPFFTATYSRNDIVEFKKTPINDGVKLIFVGSFSKGKQPLLSIKVCEELLKKYHVQLHMYGEGALFDEAKDYVSHNNLEASVFLHGNCSKEEIKKAFQESHFLIFISKSEGWPKVVAESMFWGCIPFSTRVSCVPDMLNSGERGELIDDNISNVVSKLESYISNESKFTAKSKLAIDWSRQFTLEKFEDEIKELLKHD